MDCRCLCAALEICLHLPSGILPFGDDRPFIAASLAEKVFTTASPSYQPSFSSSLCVGLNGEYVSRTRRFWEWNLVRAPCCLGNARLTDCKIFLFRYIKLVEKFFMMNCFGDFYNLVISLFFLVLTCENVLQSRYLYVLFFSYSRGRFVLSRTRSISSSANFLSKSVKASPKRKSTYQLKYTNQSPS